MDSVSTTLLLGVIVGMILFWWAEYRLGGVAFGLTASFLMVSAPLVAATSFPRLLPWLIIAEVMAVAGLVWLWRKRARPLP